MQWGADQALTTAAIVNQGFCTLPETNGVWKDHEFRGLMIRSGPGDDSLTCLKGDEDGSSKRKKEAKAQETKTLPSSGRQCLTSLTQDCTWLHFLPTVSKEQLIKSYETISKRYPGFIPADQLLP
jgi:hypothetical protein